MCSLVSLQRTFQRVVSGENQISVQRKETEIQERFKKEKGKKRSGRKTTSRAEQQ
jgi:hypothetical protein